MKSGPAYGLILGMLLAVSSVPAWAQQQASAHMDAAVQDAADSGGAASTKPHDGTYEIGSNDVLAINVWKEPDVSRSIPVRPDGKISLPLVGEIQAAGRTPLQLEHDLAAKLRTYMTDPDVTVMVEQINSEKINILGRVIKPGSYALANAGTVLDAIAGAGGFQDFAKQKSIYILRQTPGGGETRIPFNYKDAISGKHPGQNIRLQPHDTIVVP